MCNIIVQNNSSYTLKELKAIFPYNNIKKAKKTIKDNNKNYSSTDKAS